MDKKEWKKQFKQKHLTELLETETSYDYDDTECEHKKKLSAEGDDFFTIRVDDYYEITYSFDEKEAKKIDENLPDGWKLTDFIKEDKNKQYYLVEVTDGRETLRFHTEVKEENGEVGS